MSFSFLDWGPGPPVAPPGYAPEWMPQGKWQSLGSKQTVHLPSDGRLVLCSLSVVNISMCAAADRV